jgi:hypothetical protein
VALGLLNSSLNRDFLPSVCVIAIFLVRFLLAIVTYRASDREIWCRWWSNKTGAGGVSCLLVCTSSLGCKKKSVVKSSGRCHPGEGVCFVTMDGCLSIVVACDCLFVVSPLIVSVLGGRENGGGSSSSSDNSKKL